jgi:outer membrane protein assembly factor BamB
METFRITLFLSFLCLLNASADWPCWRGLNHDGIADADQNPAVKFSPSSNVKWVASVPGRGHGSPTVFGDRVFLAIADEKEMTQSLLCLDRETGKEVWTTVVHKGGFPEKMNKKASHASSTPACDGERVFINFMNGGAAHTTALTLDGKQIWQSKICDYIVHQGYGSSPALYKSMVIVSADNKSGGAVCAFDRKDGKLIWKVDRPKMPNYASPVIHTIGGRDQLILQGCELVTSIDPMTGKKIWEHEGATTECVSSIVTDGEHVFTSGGYPRNHVAAMKADGSGDIVWENGSRVYVPSMIVRDGFLFAVTDNGVAICWNSKTGEEMWKERLGREVSGTPILVGDRIYSGDESGQIFVFSADPKKFEILSENKMGDQTLSTPAICDGQIFVRVAVDEGNVRQEKLFCIEAKE